MTDDIKALVAAAAHARQKAYAPYAGYPVGAALRSADGRVFTGVNLENASYPAGLCAERAALSAACALARESGVSEALALLLEQQRDAAPRGLDKTFDL